MITELIVTSAPRGLQAGRSGFTTVYRTRGIHPELASRLEAASGYRHVYPQGDPRNPVVFSYTSKPSLLGEVWVMSRIGDAGTDYTGRSNKIAHHVAIPPADLASLVSSNPAAVMAALSAAGGLMSQWHGEPRESAAPPRLPSPASQPARCERWAAVAGDPGWAGVLVERALNKEATWVVAPPGTDFLGLFSEALALVNPSQRWQIPFTTFSLRGDEGRWLGTVAGSAEAEAAIAQKRIPVIDLTKPQTEPASSPYVLAARGQASVPWLRPTAAGSPSRAPLSTASPHAVSQPLPATLSGDLSSPMGLPPILSRPAPLPHVKPPELDEWVEVELTPHRPGRLPLLLAAGATIVAVVALGGWAGYQFDLFPKAWTKALIVRAGSDGPTNIVPRDNASASGMADTRNNESSAAPARSISEAEDQIKQTSQPAASPESVSSSPTNQPAAGPLPQARPIVDAGPDVMQLLVSAKASNTHMPEEGIQALEKGEKANLISWKQQARTCSPKDVTLRLSENAAPLQLKRQDVGENPESCSWTCRGAGGPLGTFRVTQTGVVFESQVPKEDILASGLPFVPLVITGSHSGMAKTAWVQLFSPERRGECIAVGNGKSERMLQFAAAGEAGIRPLAGFMSTRLQWKSLKASALSGTTRILLAVSPTQEQDFKMASEIAFGVSPADLTLYWCPIDLLRYEGKSSTYYEALNVRCAPQIPVSASALFGIEDFLVSDVITLKRGETSLNLNALRTSPSITASYWETVCNGFAKHCVTIAAQKPSSNVALLKSAVGADFFKRKDQRPLWNWIDDLHNFIVRLKSFDDHVSSKMRPPPAPKQFRKKGEREDEKVYDTELQKHLDQEAKEKNKYEEEKNAKKNDPWEFRAWGEKALLPDSGASIEHKLLYALWRRLHTYRVVTAGGYHFPVEETNNGNQDSKSLKQLADEAQLQLSGQLVVRWAVDDFTPHLSGEPLDVLLVDIPACPPAGK